MLGGHCNGGVVALEMAHQLRAAGERVKVVVLVDMPAPTYCRRALRRTVDVLARLRGLSPEGRAELDLRIARALEGVAWWACYYQDRLRILARSGVPAQADFVWRKLAGAAWHVLGGLGDRPASKGGAPTHPASAALAEPLQAYRRTIRRYVPAPYAGPVVLFRAEELPAKRADLGWSRLLPRLEVAVIPGDHHTCITRHVTAFATRLEEFIQSAETGA